MVTIGFSPDTLRASLFPCLVLALSAAAHAGPGRAVGGPAGPSSIQTFGSRGLSATVEVDPEDAWCYVLKSRNKEVARGRLAGVLRGNEFLVDPDAQFFAGFVEGSGAKPGSRGLLVVGRDGGNFRIPVSALGGVGDEAHACQTRTIRCGTPQGGPWSLDLPRLRHAWLDGTRMLLRIDRCGRDGLLVVDMIYPAVRVGRSADLHSTLQDGHTTARRHALEVALELGMVDLAPRSSSIAAARHDRVWILALGLLALAGDESAERELRSVLGGRNPELLEEPMAVRERIRYGSNERMAVRTLLRLELASPTDGERITWIVDAFDQEPNDRGLAWLAQVDPGDLCDVRAPVLELLGALLDHSPERPGMADSTLRRSWEVGESWMRPHLERWRDDGAGERSRVAAELLASR